MVYPFELLNSIRNGKTANINSCRKAKVPFEKEIAKTIIFKFSAKKIKKN